MSKQDKQPINPAAKDLSMSAGSLVVWIPFRDSDGKLDVSEATAHEMCGDDMLNDGWRWMKFNAENGEDMHE